MSDIQATAFADLDRLLDEMLDRPPSERKQWVDALAPEHEVLKPRLLALLSHAAAAGTDDFLNTLPKVEMGSDEPVERSGVSGNAGDEVGPYRLVRELGTGGMGSVWLAERTDVLINRPIALKLPHGPWKRAGLAERMAREREILATLTHANIARLYDAGVTADGQPWLAIEYVEGRPIDEYCKENQLSIKDRLKLFLQVANAVAYAHAKLVIHRDLKPANILVTSAGEARLLDFGIAELVEGGQTKATQLTELSGRALTPDYASPEQIAGEPLTIATDVYSLGVVLYELATGARPYKLKRDSRGALEDAILQTEPSRPSDTVSKALRKSIKGDLDSILLKALKKKPEERYGTVGAFVDDVERYLARRPVAAQPDRAWYRFRKFIRRNRLTTSATAGIVIAVFCGAGAALWQAREAIAERERAEQVTRLIAAVFENASPYAGRGETITGVSLLRQARDRLNAQTDLPVQTRVELMTLIASSFVGLGDYASADAIAEAVVRLALDKLGPEHPLALRARLVRMEVKRYRGDTDTISRELPELLSQLRSAAEQAPEPLVSGLLLRAHLAVDKGEYASAVEAAEEAMAAARAHLDPLHVLLVDSSLMVAVAAGYEANTDAALTAARSAFSRTERTFGHSPKHAKWIDAFAILGRAQGRAGGYTEAIKNLQEAVLRAKVAMGPENPVVGFYASDIARFQIALGDVASGLESSEESLAIIESFANRDSYTYGVALQRRGDALFAARRHADAEGLYRQSAEVLKAALGENHKITQLTLISFWLCSAYGGNVADARGAIDTIARNQDLPDEVLRRATYASALLHSMSERNEYGSEDESRIVSILREPSLNPSERAQFLSMLGRIQLESGVSQRAAVVLLQAMTAYQQMRSPMHPAYADVLTAYGRAMLMLSNTDEALPTLREAFAYWDAYDPGSRWAGEASLWLGRCYLTIGLTAEATIALARAETILSRSPIQSDTELVKLAHQLLAQLSASTASQ